MCDIWWSINRTIIKKKLYILATLNIRRKLFKYNIVLLIMAIPIQLHVIQTDENENNRSATVNIITKYQVFYE